MMKKEKEEAANSTQIAVGGLRKADTKVAGGLQKAAGRLWQGGVAMHAWVVDENGPSST